MKTQIEKTNENRINSLADLHATQILIKEQLNNKENDICKIWNDIFHKPSANTLSSPTGRVISLLANSAGIIDGIILTWKLYRRFGGTIRQIKKK